MVINMDLEVDNDFGIKDAMTFDVITAGSDMNISDVADLMTKNDISSVVIKDESVEGIVTTNNIISKVVSKNISPKDISASMVMDKYVDVDINTSLYEASSLMIKNKVKTLLVFENEVFTGILTLTDIVRISPEMVQIFIDQKSIEDTNFHDNGNYTSDYNENIDEGIQAGGRDGKRRKVRA